MAIEAVYFDGETARDNRVVVSLERRACTFRARRSRPKRGVYRASLRLIRPIPGQPLRLSHESQPGARLSIRNDAFTQQLLIAAPHLKGGFHPTRALRLFAVDRRRPYHSGRPHLSHPQFCAAETGGAAARCMEQAGGRADGGFAGSGAQRSVKLPAATGPSRRCWQILRREIRICRRCACASMTFPS